MSPPPKRRIARRSDTAPRRARRGRCVLVPLPPDPTVEIARREIDDPNRRRELVLLLAGLLSDRRES